jgi:hypothetical protein
VRVLAPKAPWSAVVPTTALVVRRGRRQLRSASLPHSKALRAFSFTMASPEAHEISAQNDRGQ